MTKNQELEMLKDFIQTLPKDGYLRDWLNGVYSSVETDIRSDFYPIITIKLCKDECERLLKVAQDEAENIVKQAKVEKERVQSSTQNIVRQAYNDLHKAIKQLGY